jgi:hypothetical protein
MTMGEQCAPGTAALYGMLCKSSDYQQDRAERTRAMMLSWVDDYEREMGYGDPESGKGPRTSQIRRWWREMGEPEIV